MTKKTIPNIKFGFGSAWRQHEDETWLVLASRQPTKRANDAGGARLQSKPLRARRKTMN